MAPFNIDEATPGDSDVASQFPAAERTFRETVEDWITTEHGTSGHHRIPVLTTSARDAITDWEWGSMIFNLTTGVLEIQTDEDASPMTWEPAVDPEEPTPAFPSGTIMLFQQTAAPTGWTKNTTHNDKALRVVSGAASSGGSSDFSTVFGLQTTSSFTLTSSHIPAHTHSLSGSFAFSGTTGSGGAHTPTGLAYGNEQGGSRSAISSSTPSGDVTAHESSAHTGSSGVTSWDLFGPVVMDDVAAHTHSFSGNITLSGSSGSTGSGSGHSHAIELRVKYVDIILATKD